MLDIRLCDQSKEQLVYSPAAAAPAVLIFGRHLPVSLQDSCVIVILRDLKSPLCADARKISLNQVVIMRKELLKVIYTYIYISDTINQALK